LSAPASLHVLTNLGLDALVFTASLHELKFQT
jgi:hypothetical protein